MKIFTILSLIFLSVFPSFKIEESEGLLSYIVDNVVSCELSSEMMNTESMTESMEVLMTYKPSKNMQGFVHLAKGVIYNNIHDYDSALSEFKKAKAILFNTSEIHHYLIAVLCTARAYIQSGQYSSALFQMEIIRNNYKTLCPEQISYYYDIMLCNNSHYSLLPNVKIVQEYLSQVDRSFINWGLIIKVLLQSGEIEDCAPFYDKEILPGRFVSHSEVMLIKSFILDSVPGLSKYQQIYKECPLHFGFAPNINASLIKDIEIRHNNMIIARNRKNLICIFTIIIAVFAIGYYIAGVSKYHKFEEQLTILLSDKERSQLIRRRLRLSSDVLHSVDKRLRLLDNYILAYMSGNYINEANGHLKQYIDDVDTFLQTTIHSFLIAHPRFIRYLMEQGLSDKEIACCCLYASGFKGKTIANYLGWKRGYDKSVEIRRKLNIKGAKVNIDTFLIRKMSELDS